MTVGFLVERFLPKYCQYHITNTWADPGGGGGSGGPDPPFLAHDVGFLTLGPTLDPLLWLVDLDLRWTPLFKNPAFTVAGSAPANITNTQTQT